MALLYFREKECDVVVMECGLGGRDDATNVIPAPLVSVFAHIDLDHKRILGDTLEEIADCKSGIIKTGTSVVSGISPISWAREASWMRKRWIIWRSSR